MLFFKKKFFPIKTTIFVHKENSYYTMNHTVEDLSLFNALRQGMVILLTIYSEGTILCCVPMLTAWCRWKMPKRLFRR